MWSLNHWMTREVLYVSKIYIIIELPTISSSFFEKSLFVYLFWRKKWQPTPVFLPGSLVGYSRWGSQRVLHDWSNLAWQQTIRVRVKQTLVSCGLSTLYYSSLVVQRVKNLPAMQETWVRSLGQEDPLEKGMATHSSILAWRIPWTEEY